MEMTTKSKVLKLLLSFIKIIIYSNLLVSLCVAAYTHLTYTLFKLPKDNSWLILLIVFCFTFITYNGQRLFRLKQKVSTYRDLGERLQWVVKHQKILSLFSGLAGLTGFISIFFISSTCWVLLIPMGVLSLFYVVPLPFIKKSFREINYVKIYFIALVWSLIIIGLPFIESYGFNFNFNNFLLAFSQCFIFIFAITLPFDIRDIPFDKNTNLKTIPLVLGIDNTIIFIQILLSFSLIIFYFLPINQNHLFGLLIAHLITMIITLFANENRKELFYAGWIESTVLILWLSVFLSDYLF